ERLTVQGFVGMNKRGSRYDYICDCGTLVTVDGVKLRNGHTKNCGCLKHEMSREHGKLQKHGHGRPGEQSPTYIAWCGMIQRCSNSRKRHYDRYGGRGIKVCDRWLGSDGFTNFLADMG